MSHPAPENRCEHTDHAGRRCRMVRSATHPNLCHWHAVSEERKLLEARERAARSSPEYNLVPQLLGPVTDFRTATAINHVLGRLVLLLASNSISAARASAINRSCNMLLQSLRELKYELWQARTNPLEHAATTALVEHLPPLSYLQPRRSSQHSADPDSGSRKPEPPDASQENSNAQRAQ